MKKFLVISAAVSLMSTAAFAASTTTPSITSAKVEKAGVHTISIPVAVGLQAQKAKNVALFGSVAASSQSAKQAVTSTSIVTTGSAGTIGQH